MKKIFVVILTLVVLFLSGCATTGTPTGAGQDIALTIVTDYKIAGVTIEGLHKTIATMCSSGKIGASDCAKFKVIYNDKVQPIYKAAGNVIVTYLDAKDAIDKKTNMEAYQKAMGSLAVLISELSVIIQQNSK